MDVAPQDALRDRETTHHKIPDNGMRDYEITGKGTAVRPNPSENLGCEIPLANKKQDASASARFHPAGSPRCRAGAGRSTWYSQGGKRAFDFVTSFAGLVVLAIPMTVITLAICLLEGRPVFFCQQRVGKHGRLFTIYKFRTMNNAAGSASTITTIGDSRITPLGRWVRRFKLDELPQLWNVLRGDMSFVGPRPDVPGYADQLQGEARCILLLRPGITGPATLAFRNEEKLLANVADPKAYNDEIIFPRKVRLNMEYANTLTLRKDVELILKTIFSYAKTKQITNG